MQGAAKAFAHRAKEIQQQVGSIGEDVCGEGHARNKQILAFGFSRIVLVDENAHFVERFTSFFVLEGAG